jgi:hypothetical protein
MKTDQNKIWAKIVAKAWADEDYKRRLLDDPAEVLKAEGLDIPEGWEVKVLESTEKQALLVLPPKPEGCVEEGEERLAADIGIWRCY